MKKTMRLWIVMGVCLAMPVTGQAAGSKITPEEFEQMRQSQQEIQQKLADMTNTVNQARQEFQQIKGTIEESSHFNTEHRTQIQNLEEEVRTLQDRIHVLSLQINDILSGKITPNLSQKQKEEADAYFLGLSAYNADKLTSARDIWSNFLRTYPKSSWKPHTFFWIGETYYRAGEYQKAVQAYQQVVQGSPQGLWFRRALFKQGMSFFNMKDYDSASAFFTKVATEYPKTTEGWRAQEYGHKAAEILKQQSAAKALPK